MGERKRTAHGGAEEKRERKTGPKEDLLPGAALLAAAARHEVSVSGARLSYQVIGEGPALLFIMGFLARGLAWRHQLEALAPRWRCIIFDNRGIGESHAERQSSGMHELAEDALCRRLVEAIDEAGLAPWHNAVVWGRLCDARRACRARLLHAAD